MKKKITIISGVLAFVIALGIGMYTSNASQASPKLNLKEVKSLISSQFPGEITELELDKENNRAVYEIEIENDEMEYELKVDANSGEILKLKEKRIAKKEKMEKERDDDDATEKITLAKEENKEKNTASNHTPQTNVESKEAKNEPKQEIKQQPKKEVKQQAKQEVKQQPKQEVKQQAKAEPKKEVKQQPKQENKKTIISRARAIEIALAEFPGKVEDVELDDDDGRLIYEVEIESGDREAEIEIDAMTGKIIVIDIDD